MTQYKYAVSKDLLDQIHDELANYMDDLDEVITNYGGRRMYGKECIGWIHDSGPLRFGAALFQAIVEVSRQNPKAHDPILMLVQDEDWYALTSLVGSGDVDSMGHRVVTYFPNLTLEKEE